MDFSGKFNAKTAIWKDHVPRVDRIAIDGVEDEKKAEKKMIQIAQETSDQNGLEVSASLHFGDRYVSSFRAFPQKVAA